MNTSNLVVSLAIILVMVVLCQQIMVNAMCNQKNKNDYAEINHVKYGLFNVNEWKRKLP